MSTARQHGRVNGNRAECENTQTLSLDSCLDYPAIGLRSLGVEKRGHDPYCARRWCLDPSCIELAGQKPIRDLGKDACSIASSIGRFGATVLKPDQTFDG